MFDPAIILQIVALGLLGWNLRQTHLLTGDVRVLMDRDRRKDRRHYETRPDPNQEIVS